MKHSTNNISNQFASFFNKEGLEEPLALLFDKMMQGHVCINTEKELSKGDFIDLVATAESELKPFVYFKNKLYTGRNFYYETQIINHLTRLSKSKVPDVFNKLNLNKVKDFITKLQSVDENLNTFTEDEKPDWQLVAALNALDKQISIITGGPGTGKTTTVAKVLSILNQLNPKLKIELAAPTGKASVRMKESLIQSTGNNRYYEIDDLINEIKPKTIHRLLRYNYHSPFFKKNQENPIKADVIIVDECSMIDVALFAKLLDAIADGTKLILLGDSNQLSPVGAGSVFGDICAALEHSENKFKAQKIAFFNEYLAKDRKLSNAFNLDQKDKTVFLDQHLVRLQKTYRYDAQSKMGDFTSNIIKGKADYAMKYIVNQDDALRIDLKYEESLLIEFAKKFKAYIEEEDIKEAIIQLNDNRILCAVKKSKLGVYAINEKIENLLKGMYRKNKYLFDPNKKDFYHNQPILVTKNMNDLGLYNGDVGLIRKNHKGQMMAYFPSTGEEDEYGKIEGKDLKAINPNLISDFETVFAMTIHKSQGSEFKNIFIVLPKNEDNKVLTRELLYTAITRAKKGGEIIIQTSEATLKNAISRKTERVSGIVERLKN